jgi:glycosyltransferase involved in cell wall biosynthesis
LVDAVEDEVTGLLVPSGDVAALRAAMARMLGDAKLRERFGAAARKRAASEVQATPELVAALAAAAG